MDKKRFSIAKLVKPSKVDLFLGCMMITFGVVMLLVFWPIGAFILIVGFALTFQGDRLEGFCPYCDHRVVVGTGKTGFDCDTCSKRIIVDGLRNEFHRVRDDSDPA